MKYISVLVLAVIAYLIWKSRQGKQVADSGHVMTLPTQTLPLAALVDPVLPAAGHIPNEFPGYPSTPRPPQIQCSGMWDIFNVLGKKNCIPLQTEGTTEGERLARNLVSRFQRSNVSRFQRSIAS